MSRTDRSKTAGAPEYLVDDSNPNRIRVWVRADIFQAVARIVDVDDRRAGADLAIERIAAQLRKTRAA